MVQQPRGSTPKSDTTSPTNISGNGIPHFWVAGTSGETSHARHPQPTLMSSTIPTKSTPDMSAHLQTLSLLSSPRTCATRQHTSSQPTTRRDLEGNSSLAHVVCLQITLHTRLPQERITTSRGTHSEKEQLPREKTTRRFRLDLNQTAAQHPRSTPSSQPTSTPSTPQVRRAHSARAQVGSTIYTTLLKKDRARRCVTIPSLLTNLRLARIEAHSVSCQERPRHFNLCDQEPGGNLAASPSPETAKKEGDARRLNHLGNPSHQSGGIQRFSFLKIQTKREAFLARG